VDSGEKTEEPTAKKREKFREEGKVAVSRDVSGVAVAAATLCVLVLQGSSLLDAVREQFANTGDAVASVPKLDAISVAWVAAQQTGAACLALFGATALVALLVAALAGVAQTGGNWSTKAIGFKLERLGLLTGLKRTLFSLEAVQQVGLSVAKALALGGALTVVLWFALPELGTLAHVSVGAGMSVVGRVLLQLFLVALLASAALAALDLFLTRRRVHEQMKMSKQEVKEELKQAEGDPHVKGRLRQRMREIGRNQMIAATRKADVVVVNPTHYAVALAYRFGQVGAPKLLAKGTDAVAGRIREVARKHQIPIVANPPVARAIHATARVGEEVPPQLYDMVARVLAYLYRLRNRGAAA
jgi:flagellar biosynthetic protein FlhB